jgi:hypothetical protein
MQFAHQVTHDAEQPRRLLGRVLRRRRFLHRLHFLLWCRARMHVSSGPLRANHRLAYDQRPGPLAWRTRRLPRATDLTSNARVSFGDGGLAQVMSTSASDGWVHSARSIFRLSYS